MNVMNMDILSWTVLIKYPLQEQQCHITRHIEITTPDQALDTAEKIKKEETVPDHRLDIVDIAALAIMTCTEVAPDCNKGMGTATIEAGQGIPIQYTEATVTEPTLTYHTSHTADHPHIAAHQVTPLRTAVDHVHTHPTDHQNIIHTTEDHAVQDHTTTREPKNHTLVEKGRSKLKNLFQITTVQTIIPPTQKKNQSLLTGGALS